MADLISPLKFILAQFIVLCFICTSSGNNPTQPNPGTIDPAATLKLNESELRDFEDKDNWPYAKMPFILYYSWFAACKAYHGIGFQLNESSIDLLFHCVNDPWFETIEMCKEFVHAQYPQLNFKRDVSYVNQSISDSVTPDPEILHRNIRATTVHIDYTFYDINFSDFYTRVPRVVLDCALNKSGYNRINYGGESVWPAYTNILCLVILAWISNKLFH